MLNELNSYAKRREDFSFETTLSGRSYMSLIRRLRISGYKVHFFFVWILTVELALTRVRGRDGPCRVVTMCPRVSSVEGSIARFGTPLRSTFGW